MSEPHPPPPNDAPFEEGFDLNTIIAAIFVAVIMVPGTIYLGLVTGGSIGGAAQWVTVILFIEITKRSFIRLRRQEIYMIYLVSAGLLAPGMVMGAAGLTLQGGAFGELIWRQFLVRSPQAEAFQIADKIPRWVVPPAGSEALLRRTFLNREWLLPIGVLLVHQILWRMNFLGLGYVLYRVTNDYEQLPFPLAPVAAEGATALADASAKRETWRWRVFSIGTMMGLAFGAIYVGIPTFTGITLTKPLVLLEIPFYDLTHKIGALLPGAMLGLGTDLGMVLVGFILPFPVVVGTIVGAVFAKIVLPPILFHYGMLPTWREGMTAIPTDVALNIDLFISFGIGAGIVVALLGMAQVWRGFRSLQSRKSAPRRPKSSAIVPGRGDIPIWAALGIWAVSAGLYVLLCHVLVPDFPVPLLVVFGFFLTPMLSYISARMFGITGVATGMSFPMVREGTFILSGYQGIDIWFAPVPYYDHGYMAQRFKELELTRTKFGSYIKMEITAFTLMMISSFLFWQLIWRMGPIPSSVYPFVQKMWPLFATYKALWATTTLEGGARWMLEAITVNKVAAGAGTAGLILLVTRLAGWPMTFFYGMVGGMATWPHYAIPMFTGALLGRYVFQKRFGRDQWMKWVPILLAGFYCGMGLTGMLATALALIGKAVTPLVF